jgi:hypothetical protein
METAVWLYALTIFLSAFLLFQVQPLFGKSILPWFGGGPAIWTTCMLFFQTILLAGYAYAHLIRTRLGEWSQMIVHLVVLGAAMVLLPITPYEALKPVGGDDPTWRILAVLMVGVGLPYFALSATSPLIQAWFSATFPGASPYRLYALSNLGSLLALATYPFVIEPALALRTQSGVWSAAFAAFAVLCAGCAIKAWRSGTPAPGRVNGLQACTAEGGCATSASTVEDGDATSVSTAEGGCATIEVAPRPRLMARVLWLLLPACGSVMLLAITNQMCADVGVFPFLWILPLGLYLLSFILCFESERVYWRPVWLPLMAAGAVAIIWLLFEGVHVAMLWQVAGYSGALFACCMVCHGELARLKPHPHYLTSFYLFSSAGGAVGGLFVTLLAPVVFQTYGELHVGLFACFALAAVAFWYEKWHNRRWQDMWALPLAGVSSVVAVGAVGSVLVVEARQELENALSVSRNFYGVLQVHEYNTEDPERHYYSLQHGRILHGVQYVSEPLHSQPTSYYGESSGVGVAILNRRPKTPIKIGVVGLGTGSLAVYGGKGDTVRFYEINPEVLRLATSRFTYVTDCRARNDGTGGGCDVVLGDARLSLEREEPQGFDILALDAFTSDAIPVHLLTVEAFQIYQKHLKPDGVLAVHISNRFLDLKPVVLGVAERLGLSTAVIDADDEGGKEELSSSNWILVSKDKAFLESPAVAGVSWKEDPAKPCKRRVWTDDYSDLFSIMRWRESTSTTEEEDESPPMPPATSDTSSGAPSTQ